MTKYLYLNGNGKQRFFCLPRHTEHIHWVKIAAFPRSNGAMPFNEKEPG